MSFQELLKGIDSLYMSFKGSLKAGLLEELEIKKQKAQSDEVEDSSDAVMNIGDHHFEVRDKGQGYFSYVLADGWFYIKISASAKKLVPTVYVQISSELLNCHGIDSAVASLYKVLDVLMESITSAQVSRADMFVDFHTDVDFGSIHRKSWITRVDKIDIYWSGNRFNGWVIGRGGDISARLYDKTIEIGISKKDFFKPLWSQQGFQEDQDVLRFELQLRRPFLKQFGIDSLPDLQGKMNDIWQFATCEWLRLGVDNADENRSRWPTAPVWMDIQQVKFGDGSFTGAKREVSKSRIPNKETVLVNGLGYLITYAVICGFDNLAEALHNFLLDVGTYLDVCGMDPKNTRFVDSLDYINKRMKEKKRKFNKPIQ
jgi:hypothetical protein